MTTNLQSWQFAPPYVNEIRYVIRNTILNERNEDGEDWVRYYNTLSAKSWSINLANKSFWKQSPDPVFNNIWSTKYNALVKVYEMVGAYYEANSLPAYTAELRKEKLDQAIDFLSDEQTDLEQYQLLEMEATIKGITLKQVAESVVEEYSARLLEQMDLEKFKLEKTLSILNAPCISDIQDVMKDVSDELG